MRARDTKCDGCGRKQGKGEKVGPAAKDNLRDMKITKPDPRARTKAILLCPDCIRKEVERIRKEVERT